MSNHEGEKALIIAILNNALSEAISTQKTINTRAARDFIDSHNWLFSFYCQILGWEPQYVEKKMWIIIDQCDRDKSRGKRRRAKMRRIWSPLVRVRDAETE